MSRSCTNLSPESMEIVRLANGRDLQDMAERGIHLPADARRRLKQWQDEQTARDRDAVRRENAHYAEAKPA